jgi:hypothetical protein
MVAVVFHEAENTADDIEKCGSDLGETRESVTCNALHRNDRNAELLCFPNSDFEERDLDRQDVNDVTVTDIQTLSFLPGPDHHHPHSHALSASLLEHDEADRISIEKIEKN